MKSASYKFDQIQQLASIVKAYRNQDSRLFQYYSYSHDADGIQQAIKDIDAYSYNRNLLYKVLKKQNQNVFEQFEAVENNIELIQKEKTLTITTGHQLSLSTGPAFLFYKLINTIALSNRLSLEHPDYNFVPVFWMASEDHDFEEISQTTIFGKHFIWEDNFKGPTGRINAENAKTTIAEISAQFGDQSVDEHCHKILTEAYHKETLAAATRHLITSFLGDEGIVILDADDPDLKAEVQEEFKVELFQNTASAAWQESSAALEKLGYENQLHIRPINLFYMEDDYRARIEQSDQGFQTVDGQISWSHEEMKNLIAEHPEKISPNAAFRPVYQQKLLPNIAYIGGAGETAYWLQLKSGFEALEVFYPAVLLRNSIYFLDGGDCKKMEKSGLNFEDFFTDVHQLEAKISQKNSDKDADLQKELKDLMNTLAKVKEKATLIDGSLDGKVGGMEANIRNMIEGLEKRLVKSQKQNNETMINQVHKVRDKLLPNGLPQERVESFLSFYVKQGGEGLIKELIAEMNVLEEEVIVKY